MGVSYVNLHSFLHARHPVSASHDQRNCSLTLQLSFTKLVSLICSIRQAAVL